MSEYSKLLISISQELQIVLDEARGDCPKGPWIEAMLWTTEAIQANARRIGIMDPERPMDRRGKCRNARVDRSPEAKRKRLGFDK